MKKNMTTQHIMANPFTGIITQAFKDLHKHAIDATLEDTALTEACVLHYESKWTDCPNCGFNGLTGKSNGIYTDGGPVPFDGICPYCNGHGRVQEPQNETLHLMTIWDSKRFIPQVGVNLGDIAVQTMSKIITYPNLSRATSATISSNIQKYGTADFVRLGEPGPLGFGASNFILCSWGRA